MNFIYVLSRKILSWIGFSSSNITYKIFGWNIFEKKTENFNPNPHIISIITAAINSFIFWLLCNIIKKLFLWLWNTKKKNENNSNKDKIPVPEKKNGENWFKGKGIRIGGTNK